MYGDAVVWFNGIGCSSSLPSLPYYAVDEKAGLHTTMADATTSLNKGNNKQISKCRDSSSLCSLHLSSDAVVDRYSSFAEFCIRRKSSGRTRGNH
jgi:hypothetical protein